MPVPTFSEYGEALEECGCKINYFEMQKPFQLTEALVQEISDGDYDFWRFATLTTRQAV